MKVAGFTFVRNAVKYDYPITEAIRSILPLCDEVVVSLGNSEDDTEGLILSLQSEKIKLVHSVWDDSVRKGGMVLAMETDKAFDQVPADADWCIYIQADEVIHEKYYRTIREVMQKYKDDPMVEGLLFKYLHFYASYDYIGDSRKWYSHEIRVIRNDKTIRSYLDAQGFRKNGQKLKVKSVDAYIYHYGWVKHPADQLRKINNFLKFWNLSDDPGVKIPQLEKNKFDYGEIDSLQLFKDSHPQVMLERVATKNWIVDLDISRKKFSLKERILYWIEKKFGKRFFEYRNYKII